MKYFSSQGETDDEAEFQFQNLMTSSDEDPAADENESTPSNKSSLLSTSVIKLIIILIMTFTTCQMCCSDHLVFFFEKTAAPFSRLLHCTTLKLISDLLPESLYMIRNFFGVNKDDFEKVNVCPTCSSCYSPEECVRTRQMISIRASITVLWSFQTVHN